MKPQPQKGYLLLADISGYTAFMANTELEHAPLVLNQIINFLTKELTPTLQLIEVEGDALFLCASEEDISRGELLLELVEATYVNFRDCKRTMMHNITCSCKACQAVTTLDLKFIVHYGEYMLQKVAGKVKPFGSSVNLAHRLLKNGVTKATGWQGYGLFTKACLDKMEVCPENMYEGVEKYDHFGEVATHSVNFDKKYQEYTDNRKVFLAPNEADVNLEYIFTAPPPIIWDWLNDPAKRNIWSAPQKVSWAVRERPDGRTGPSANNHCTSSGFIEHILDWRPFHYFTVCHKKGWVNAKITGELTSLNGGTQLKWRIKLEGKLPRILLRIISEFIVNKVLQMRRSLDNLEHMSKKQLEKDVPDTHHKPERLKEKTVDY